MARSYLTVINEMSARIGMTQLSSAYANTDPLAVQLKALFLEAARDVAREYDWQCLIQSYTFTTLAAEYQFNILSTAPGYRRMIPETVINITQKRRIFPATASEQASYTLGGSVPALYRYRIKNNGFYLLGNTTASDSVSFEYVTTHWCTSSDGVTRKSFPTDDADLILVDEELLILNAKWRFKRQNGFDYGEEFNDYQRLLQQLKSEDVEHPRLNIGVSTSNVFIDQTREFVISDS